MDRHVAVWPGASTLPLTDPVWQSVANAGLRMIERHVTGSAAPMVFTTDALILHVYTHFPTLFRTASHDQFTAVYEWIMEQVCPHKVEYPAFMEPARVEQALGQIGLEGVIGIVEFDRGVRRLYFSQKHVAALFILFLV